jgi:hypothetical protein
LGWQKYWCKIAEIVMAGIPPMEPELCFSTKQMWLQYNFLQAVVEYSNQPGAYEVKAIITKSFLKLLKDNTSLLQTSN